jgi:hypothetical protein
MSLGQTGVTIGYGRAGIDYTLTFNGETNDGVITWMEDEDYFALSDDLLMNSTERVYFNDTSSYIYDDGTNLQVVTNDDIKVTCGANKTIELQNTVYMDENFDPIIGRGASAPGLVTLDTSSIQVVAFDGTATTEQVSSTRELNHNYKEGTDLSFHIHWVPVNNNAGNVKWQLEYWITDGDGPTVRASGTLTVTAAASGTAWDTTLSVFGTVTGTTFKIGDQISLRLFRDPTDVADTYASDAAVKTYGYHYQIDTLGSRQIGTK